MSSSLRRGAFAATALAVCTAALTACGAGHNAATLKVSPGGAAQKVGDIRIQAVTLIAPQDGDGPIGVSARIFNDGDEAQQLEAIRIKGVDGRVQLSPPEGEDSLTVPADGVLALGGEGHASATAPAAGSVKTGAMQPVTFLLSDTGKVTLRAAVVPSDWEDYASFGPSQAPEGAPTTDPSPRPSAPSASPTTGEEEPGAETETQPDV